MSKQTPSNFLRYKTRSHPTTIGTLAHCIITYWWHVWELSPSNCLQYSMAYANPQSLLDGLCQPNNLHLSTVYTNPTTHHSIAYANPQYFLLKGLCQPTVTTSQWPMPLQISYPSMAYANHNPSILSGLCQPTTLFSTAYANHKFFSQRPIPTRQPFNSMAYANPTIATSQRSIPNQHTISQRSIPPIKPLSQWPTPAHNLCHVGWLLR